MEVILYSKECNWYTRCCPLNGGVFNIPLSIRTVSISSNLNSINSDVL